LDEEEEEEEEVGGEEGRKEGRRAGWRPTDCLILSDRPAPAVVLVSPFSFFSGFLSLPIPFEFCLAYPTLPPLLLSFLLSCLLLFSLVFSLLYRYDVGGQRNERKKWIHCFDDVTAVIFVAALSEYDQKLFEDVNTNRMVEAIDLFDEITNNRYFRESSMILFLNKRDLFETKIERVAIATVDAFLDYKHDEGLSNYDGGIKYFLNKFLARSKTEEKIIYHHITCATDTENVEVVFSACKDIILRDNLKDSGFLD